MKKTHVIALVISLLKSDVFIWDFRHKQDVFMNVHELTKNLPFDIGLIG